MTPSYGEGVLYGKEAGMVRYLIPMSQMSDAAKVLNTKLIDFDYDSGNRMMIADEDVAEADRAFNEADVEYDIVA